MIKALVCSAVLLAVAACASPEPGSASQAESDALNKAATDLDEQSAPPPALVPVEPGE